MPLICRSARIWVFLPKPAFILPMPSLMKKYRLEAIVFICGAAVMVLEMTGSRILAPYLGTSIFVWTSLIGIILASLSLGYWWGGKVSDQSPAFETFSRIIFAASVSIGRTRA